MYLSATFRKNISARIGATAKPTAILFEKLNFAGSLDKSILHLRHKISGSKKEDLSSF